MQRIICAFYTTWPPRVHIIKSSWYNIQSATATQKSELVKDIRYLLKYGFQRTELSCITFETFRKKKDFGEQTG